VKPGKGAAFVRTKLKNYLTGNTVDKTFRAGSSVMCPSFSEIFFFLLCVTLVSCGFSRRRNMNLLRNCLDYVSEVNLNFDD